MNLPSTLTRSFCALAVALAQVCSAPTAWAQSEPSADDVRAAGDAFNDGRAAFKAEEWAEAAEHFEKADGLAPNPKVLLLAIQARERAGQLARAATLAALAQDRYPEDESFADSRTLLMRGLSELAKVKVSCDRPCTLLVDSRLVHGEPSTKRFLFLETGSYKVRASFAEGEATSQDLEAVAGQSAKLEFVALSDSSAAAPSDSDSDWETEPAANNGDSGNGLPAPKVTYDDLSRDRAAPDTSPSAGVSPAVFWVGAGVTGLLTGVSIWSGLDTLNNPGEAEVAKCSDEQCAAYKQGKDSEFRTNLLWGATAGVGLTTILIGALWTDWGSPEPPTTAAAQRLQLGSQGKAQAARQTSFSVSGFASGEGAWIVGRGRF